MKKLYTLLLLISFSVTAQMPVELLTDGDFEANNAAYVWTGNVEIRDENDNKFFFEQNKKSKSKKILNYKHQLTKKDQQEYEKLLENNNEEDEIELYFNGSEFVDYYFKKKFNKK